MFVCCVLLDMNMCILTHVRYEGRPFRNSVRCRSLVAERTNGALARGSWLLQLSPQSCVRENCPACMSGEQHPSYVLYGRQKGRRFAVYVPEELVPEVHRCLENGRALQELLYQAAPRYVKALKREGTKAWKRRRVSGVDRRRGRSVWPIGNRCGKVIGVCGWSRCWKHRRFSRR